jgi:hypothetical protein
MEAHSTEPPQRAGPGDRSEALPFFFSDPQHRHRNTDLDLDFKSMTNEISILFKIEMYQIQMRWRRFRDILVRVQM